MHRIALFISCSALVLSAQTVHPAKRSASPAVPPSATQVKASSPAAVPARDYSNEAFVLEKYKTVYRLENDGTGTKTTSARFRVQSEAALQQLGQLVFGYSSANERLKVDYVRVVKADASVITAPESAVQDLTTQIAREAPVYSDLREKHVTVPSLRPGEVLEYQITQETFTPLAPGQFWMEHNFEQDAIVLDEVLEINVPRDRKINIKVKPAYAYKESNEDGRHIYRWTASHLAREDESDSEQLKKIRAKALEGRQKADVQLTTFGSWAEIASWYASLERERRLPDDKIKAKAAELTRDSKSDLQKVQAIYDYVAKNFRYVSLSFGVGRYQPHAATDVFSAQYGDCKDKHTLLASMLAAAGFQTDSVLIHSVRKLDEEVPSPSQFDHVISVVHLGDKRIWLDTTSEVAPFQVLLLPLRDKSALVITPQGAGTIEKTPGDLPFAAFENTEVEGKITAVGKLEAHVRSTVRNDTETLVRLTFRRIPQNRWKELMTFSNSMRGMEGEVTNVKASDPANTIEPFVFEYDLSVPNYLDISSKKSKLKLPLPSVAIEVPAKSEDEDADPLKMGAPQVTSNALKLAMPEKYTFKMPLPISVKRDYAEFQSTYSLANGTLTAVRKLTTRTPEVKPDRFTDLRSFASVINSDNDQRIGVEGPGEDAALVPQDAKASELNEAANDALDARNFKLAAELFQRLVKLEPKHEAAWNNLGRTYLNLNRYDEAIVALNKQLEVNPYDLYAYFNLGLVYERIKKTEEAIKAYKKQIEINPLDGYSHRNLGMLLNRQHRYAEAIPELEQAQSIAPDDLYIQQQLGDAYLKSGKSDLALAAFDKVIQQMPVPPMFNNVAYALAEQGEHLDRAHQYAQAAVAETVSSLRNLPDEQIVKSGAALTATLATYWDTLGWVYFRQGDLDSAQKFISAAWNNSVTGEVADHLGQIYEKRGNKEKAKELYAKALASSSEVPETRARLAALVGGDKKVDAAVNKMRESLSLERTVDLGAATNDGTAEFILIFPSGSNAGKVGEVRFSSGSDALKTMMEALKSATYPVEIADGAKIVRKGIASCSKLTKKCSFVLLPSNQELASGASVPVPAPEVPEVKQGQNR